MVPLKVRSFTGSKTLPFEFNPDARISEVKEVVSKSGLCKGAKPALEYNGHELTDNKTLSHYGVKERSVLHILPPSKAPRLSLQFEKSDGTQFTLDMKADVTVAELKRYITVEEKLDVHKLQFVTSIPDQEEPDAIIISEPQDLPETGVLSDYPLSNSTVFVYGPPPPQTPPPTFCVYMNLYDEHRKVTVEAKLQQTLQDFREAVLNQHGVSISQDVLILADKEVVGEDLPIWDLGFVPDCVVHAVPFVSLTVEIIDIKTFDPMLLHPLTKLSAIRKMLAQDTGIADEDVSFYSFTIDGSERLNEWRTLWSLNLVSGSTLYMRLFGMISIIIKVNRGMPFQIETEEDETVFGLKERLASMYGADFNDGKGVVLQHRNKTLRDEMTLKEEGLSGGEELKFLFSKSSSP